MRDYWSSANKSFFSKACDCVHFSAWDDDKGRIRFVLGKRLRSSSFVNAEGFLEVIPMLVSPLEEEWDTQRVVRVLHEAGEFATLTLTWHYAVVGPVAEGGWGLVPSSHRVNLGIKDISVRGGFEHPQVSISLPDGVPLKLVRSHMVDGERVPVGAIVGWRDVLWLKENGRLGASAPRFLNGRGWLRWAEVLIPAFAHLDVRGADL